MSLSKKIYNEFKLMQQTNIQKDNMFGGATVKTEEKIIKETDEINYEKEIRKYKKKINKLKEQLNKK